MAVHRAARSIRPSYFGALLKRFRLAAGFTQEALAERAGLSARGISDLERGVVSRPQRETLTLLIDALELSPRDRAQLESATGSASSFEIPLLAGKSIGPMGIPPLVGRVRELEIIEQHLAGETPPVLVLAGEPGIGKSRLLHEARRRAQGHSLATLHGGVQHRNGQEPYAPLIDALSHSLTRLPASKLRSVLTGCTWLARLLPELLELMQTPYPVDTLPAAQERRLIFGAVRRYLSNIAEPAGTLLVLDDLQWSGADGLDLLRSLISAEADNPVRVVAAYRDTEIQSHHPLARFLAGLAEQHLGHHVSPNPLQHDEAHDLLTQLLHGNNRLYSEISARERVLESAGGLPFFLVSYAQGLLHDEGVGPGESNVPWSAAQSIRQRVAALPPTARDVLRVASVAGRTIDRAVLVEAATKPERDVLLALDDICRARLLSEEEEQRYRFVHDVIREAIETDLGSAQRVLLHRVVAETLERQSSRRAAELAWHFCEGDLPERALTYALEAGDGASRVFAHDEAER